MKTGTSATEAAICGSRATTSGRQRRADGHAEDGPRADGDDAEIAERRTGQRRDEAGDERAEEERKRQPQTQNAAVPSNGQRDRDRAAAE
jgi:hypothetical protein